MRSLIARRKHVDLTQAIAAFYDPDTPTRDAVALWRKALRRADKGTKSVLLSMARQAKEKKSSSNNSNNGSQDQTPPKKQRF